MILKVAFLGKNSLNLSDLIVRGNNNSSSRRRSMGPLNFLTFLSQQLLGNVVCGSKITNSCCKYQPQISTTNQIFYCLWENFISEMSNFQRKVKNKWLTFPRSFLISRRVRGLHRNYGNFPPILLEKRACILINQKFFCC